MGNRSSFYRRVSLITGCYRRIDYLKRALDSWALQTYPNLELVVAVDEDSYMSYSVEALRFPTTLVTLYGMRTYRDSWVKNRCIEASTGEILIFIDSDIHILRHDWVSRCVMEIRKGAGLVMSSFLFHGRDANGISGTAVCDRWAVERVRGFNENLDGAWGYEDTDFYIRLQRAGATAAPYPHQWLWHSPHHDSIRYAYRGSNDVSDIRGPQFKQQMSISKDDMKLHPFEANLDKRCQPSEDIYVDISHLRGVSSRSQILQRSGYTRNFARPCVFGDVLDESIVDPKGADKS
jgi:glycosyltransferase involved in cell wall biosynthesis